MNPSPERSNNDWRKVMLVACCVSLVCAAVVSATHLLLEPRRQANIDQFQQQKLASMLEGVPGLQGTLFESGVDSLSQKVVDFGTGWYTEELTAEAINMVSFAEDPALSTEIPAELDAARLNRRSNYAPVYVLQNENKLAYLVLPVFGNGYQSLIRAWMVLGSDLNTVQALSVIEQNETPGLGAKITDDAWQSQFGGKVLKDNAGELVLSVAKAGSASEWQVDGITGATRTGNGISDMITFWFGEYGYGPFLEKLASGG